jgi:ATP-dependent exoDNAse (exonuclease V) alpha subunit
LNPAGDRKVERFGWTFALGDKVMEIENDYDKEVYNGDIGYIDIVSPDDGELTARFDGRPEEGCRHCGSQYFGATAMVEASKKPAAAVHWEADDGHA